MKILLLDETGPDLVTQLSRNGHQVVRMLTEPRGKVLAALPDFEGVLLRSRMNIDDDFLRAGPELKFVGRLGVGIEHIDREAAQRRGVRVINTPEGSRQAVAEHTIGLMLDLLRHITRTHGQIRQGTWERKANWGTELRSLTVGLLGYGNMGRRTARLLQGFGCRVITYDKYRTDYEDEYAEAVDLDTFRAETDLLSLHIFYEPANHYLLDDTYIGAFAKPFYLVNTARGWAVRTESLVKALQSGKIKGAALDVNEYEEQSFAQFNAKNLPAPWQYLLEADNVVLTPHLAGLTHESMVRHGEVMVEKIARFYGEG